jgi:four helix bundle protein
VILNIALEALPLDNLPQLSHEKLEVYQKSIQLLVLATQVLANAPGGHAELCDQLKRAALSVPLNIAEASGRTGSLDNAKHFSIARGSALECGAIFDVFHALQILDAKLYRQAKLLIVAEVSMLSKLCMKR